MRVLFSPDYHKNIFIISFFANLVGKKLFFIIISICFSDRNEFEYNVYQPFGFALL